MATTHTRNTPMITRDDGTYRRDIVRTEQVRGRPNWLWPVLALGVLALLALMFARGMSRRHDLTPAPRIDNQPTQQQMQNDRPGTTPDRPYERPYDQPAR